MNLSINLQLKKVNKFLLVILLFSFLGELSSQTTDDEADYPKREYIDNEKKGRVRKDNKDPAVVGPNSSFVGIYMGQRNFSNVPRDVFFEAESGELTNVDLGKGKPFIIGLQMMFQPADKGFAFPIQIEGFLGNSSGFTLNMGGGYKVGNQRFSFTPTATIGIGRIWTSIDVIPLGGAFIPASFFEEGNSAIFVGPEFQDPHERGPGSNLSFSVGSLFFQSKVSGNLSYRVGKKMVIFGDAGYNILISSGKNKFELSGKGYDNTNEFLNNDGANTPPHIITATPDAAKGIINKNRRPYEKTPYNLSGFQLQFGIAITAGSD